MLVAHCDWSLHPAKRIMTQAVAQDGCWHIGAPTPVDDPATLVARLQAQASGPVLLGFDLPIGLPEEYARAAGITDFRTALRNLPDEWFTVCETADQISLSRPFYPLRPGGTQRAHLLAGLGLSSAEDLLRRCERRTARRPAACSLFWTLGGNQVGKAAITAWRSVLIPALDHVALWPFDGPLATLLAQGKTVIAETYPGDVYHRLGMPRTGWSKRTQQGRLAVAAYLANWIGARNARLVPQMQNLIASGFGPRREGEDAFDAFVGLLGMLDVVDGHQPEGCPEDEALRKLEGWILGQTTA